jgi:hypothetical protein
MSEYHGLEDCLKDCVDKAKKTLLSHPKIKSVEITWINVNGDAMPRVYIEKFNSSTKNNSIYKKILLLNKRRKLKKKDMI